MARRERRNCAETVSASVVSLPECGSCPTNLPKMPARHTGLRMLPGGYRKASSPSTAQSATYDEHMGHCLHCLERQCYRRHRVATPAALR